MPHGDRVRPTQDRVREAVFSMLGPSVEGAVFLDAFAGTGANGFEAVSRGAKLAVMVDIDPKQRSAIETTATELGVSEQIRVIASSLPDQPGTLAASGPYDIVYADPPYIFEGWIDLLNVFSSDGVLSPKATVVAEHSAKLELPATAGPLTCASTRTYGDTAITRFTHMLHT